MKRYQVLASTLLVMLAICLVRASAGQANDDAPRMTAVELKALLTDPDLIILDVRRGTDWASSDFKIKGATHVQPEAYDEWADTYPKDGKIVLYCA